MRRLVPALVLAASVAAAQPLPPPGRNTFAARVTLDLLDGSDRGLLAGLGAALAWLIGIAGLIVAGGDLGLLVPWALFLLVPCLNAGLLADEGFGR